jgi:hypothetical protein
VQVFTVFGSRDDLPVYENLPALSVYSPDAEPLMFDNNSNPKPHQSKFNNDYFLLWFDNQRANFNTRS